MPAYNEEKNIGTVIEQWYPVVERIGGDSRLVILNDGSKDATYKKIQNLQKIMTVLSESINRMKDHGGTILRGYRYAVEKGAIIFFRRIQTARHFRRNSGSFGKNAKSAGFLSVTGRRERTGFPGFL